MVVKCGRAREALVCARGTQEVGTAVVGCVVLCVVGWVGDVRCRDVYGILLCVRGHVDVGLRGHEQGGLEAEVGR